MRDYILKKIRIGKEDYISYGWIEIDADNRKIGYIHKDGKAPYLCNVLAALIADKDVRRLAKAYIASGRSEEYTIDIREGRSGCRDFYLTTYMHGRFGELRYPLSRKKLIHESMNGKVNEGDVNMYVGDLVELIYSLKGTEYSYAFDVAQLKNPRKAHTCTYMREKKVTVWETSKKAHDIFSREED